MKVSLNGLKEYVPVEMKGADLADALTMAGLEVESVSERYDYLSTVLVGRIIEICPHPNADSLKLCDVDVGDRTIRVVCGAPGIKKGMNIPLALPGTQFPNGSILEKSVIRGEQSEGMLCSEAELGLGTDQAGIMALHPDLMPGNRLAEALGLSETILDIDLTPNRPDCLSIIGIARESAALQKARISYPEIILPEAFDHIDDFTSITIKNPELCPRYAARLIRDIKIGPSPFWLQDRLMSVGIRPINNIVDVTNFVMMETGQPLHAFDFDRLAEHRIVIRTAKKGEPFVTLDNKERKLSPDMLVICDGEKPVALAGVMGGLNSEIKENTTRVLIESAYFDPVCIRKTAKHLGISTEASHRFERGADPDGTITALNRATQLMVEVGGGRLIDGLIDEYPLTIEKKEITLSVNDTNRLLGTTLNQNDIAYYLSSIEFRVEKIDTDKLTVVPPSFRVDMSRPVDLMEEVARLSGYNNIPTTSPLIPAETNKLSKTIESRDRIKDIMTGFGFTEAINYSFINSASCDYLRLDQDDPRRNMVEILNPLTEDQAVMRTSLIPGLLKTMHYNVSQQVRNLKMFEVGKIFLNTDKDSLPKEIDMLAGLWTGTRFEASWYSKEEHCDFYDIKGAIEELFRSLGVNHITFTRMAENLCTYTKSGHTAQILVENEPAGLVGELHPQTLVSFELKQPAFIFEVNLHNFMPYIPDVKVAKPIPKFPFTYRDITLIINKSIEVATILKCVESLHEELVENLKLFDVYEGAPVPQGKKSISFRIIYRSLTETLEDEVVNRIHQNITDRLLKEFDASVPI